MSFILKQQTCPPPHACSFQGTVKTVGTSFSTSPLFRIEHPLGSVTIGIASFEPQLYILLPVINQYETL